MNTLAPIAVATVDHDRSVVSTCPDTRLGSLARKALATCGYPPVSLLECQVNNGTVILHGVLNSYYLKQVAQESVRRLGIADRIENRVTVIY